MGSEYTTQPRGLARGMSTTSHVAVPPGPSHSQTPQPECDSGQPYGLRQTFPTRPFPHLRLFKRLRRPLGRQFSWNLPFEARTPDQSQTQVATNLDPPSTPQLFASRFGSTLFFPLETLVNFIVCMVLLWIFIGIVAGLKLGFGLYEVMKARRMRNAVAAAEGLKGESSEEYRARVDAIKAALRRQNTV